MKVKKKSLKNIHTHFTSVAFIMAHDFFLKESHMEIFPQLHMVFLHLPFLMAAHNFTF
jgi:hypothetical protein